MSPFVKESRLIKQRLRVHFPQASANGIKRASHAACYGATPAQIAKILRDDAKENAITLEVRK